VLPRCCGGPMIEAFEQGHSRDVIEQVRHHTSSRASSSRCSRSLRSAAASRSSRTPPSMLRSQNILFSLYRPKKMVAIIRIFRRHNIELLTHC
jgi:hypothetical protein